MGETGVVALLRNGEGPTVMLLPREGRASATRSRMWFPDPREPPPGHPANILILCL
jgi:hypothetical protein